MKKFLFVLVALVVVGWGASSAASLSTMENYLDRWCSDYDPVRSCGTYQDDLEDAHEKLVKLHTVLDDYDAATRANLMDQLVDEFTDLFDRSSATRTKVLAAYYAVMMDADYEEAFDTDDVLAYLFDESSSLYTRTRTSTRTSTRYVTPISDGDGSLKTFSSIDGRTRMNVSRREIEVSGRTMELRIRAVDDDNNTATLNKGYRVVAELNGRTYAASYDDGDWEFRFGDTLRSGDDIEFLLLCKYCTSGTRYSSDTVLNGRYVVDAETFEIRGSLSSSSSNNYNNYNNYNSSTRNYDLALRDVSWRYDITGRDVVVRLTTTVRNEGRYDNILEELNYTIEVDNDRLSTREYDIDHIETECDDRNVSRSQDDNIRVDEDDECEVVVEITLDRDDTEDEYIEIEVELEADRDDYRSNDSETVRFRVD